MTKEPRIWRKTRDGKAYGCWWVTVNRNDVNLNTKSAEIARGRLPEALAGKTKGWPSDAELAARAMDSAAPVPAGAPAPGQAAPTSSAGAPAAAAGPPVVPDGVLPPSTNGNTGVAPPLALPPAEAGAPPTSNDEQASARAEAEATNAAAAETAGNPANDNAGDAGPAFALGADAIRGMLGQGAAAIVELQLGLQAWLVFKRTGKIAPPIAPDSPIRKWAADAWVAQFEAWFPNMDTVPPWILAVGLPAMALPVQFMAAQPPPPETRPADAAAPTPAPTVSQPEQAAA